MYELLISTHLLAAIFFIVALVYSSVGLGGGTSYTALLAVFGASHRVIPPVSLTMNVIVTVVGAFNYIRAGHARVKLIAPLLCASVPAAYLGASIEVESSLFYPLLVAVLILVAARLFFWSRVEFEIAWKDSVKLVVLVVIGALLGLISGVVGIGGGIFLVPIIIILGLGDARVAAATGAIFILCNSLSGLSGHLQRNIPDIMEILPLVVAVVCGALIGSHLGAVKWNRDTIQKVMGGVLLVAIALLSLRLW